MRFPATVILLTVLLAGCVSQPSKPSDVTLSNNRGDEGPEPAGMPSGRSDLNQSEPVKSPEPKMVDCELYPMAFDVPAEDVQAKLPTGYAPAGFVVNEITPVILQLHACKSLVLDNETVVAPFSLMLTRAMVVVNKNLKNESVDLHDYVFEVFVTDERVRDVFRTHGLPATLSQLLVTKEPLKTRVQVGVEGKVWYDVTLAGVGREAGNFANVLREHYISNGQPVWADFDLTYTGSTDVSGVVMQVHDGVMKGMRTGDQGLMQGGSTPGHATAEIRFGHLS